MVEMDDSLWMRTSQYDTALADFAIDNSCGSLSRVDVKFSGVASKSLNTAILELVGINEDAASVVVRSERFGNSTTAAHQGFLVNGELDSACTSFAVIDETRKSEAAAGARIESELSLADDFHLLVADLELAALAGVVAAGAEAEVVAAAVDILGDAAIALAVQGAAVAQVSAAGNDKQGA